MKDFKGWIYAAVIFYFMTHSLTIFAEDFKMPTPEGNLLFDNTSKPYKLVNFFAWAMRAGCGISAMGLFVSSGNSASRGDWGRCAGALIGAIIAALAAALVSIVNK